MKIRSKVQLYWNTIKYLQPIQIRYQIKNRIRRKINRHVLKDSCSSFELEIQEIRILIPEIDCEKEYLQRFDVNKLLDNYIILLHEEHRIENNWNIEDASHLWNYNLHYLEFLIPLAVQYIETGEKQYFTKWKELIKSWLEHPSKDSFEPYTISMRIPNILICMEILRTELRGTELERKLIATIWQQYMYLLHTQELSLLANHYFENLKTIVICSILFKELSIYHKYYELFLEQIDEQILPDGIHFERSPMYHKIILEDILRVYRVLYFSGYICDADKLMSVIHNMTMAMIELERGFDRTPLFNDVGNNISKSKQVLYKAIQKMYDFEETDKWSLEHSGYFKLSNQKCEILFDCGDIGPSYMGGHSHCDCLSFELSVCGKVIFANSGTGQYQGELRSFFRSTAAHNTIMIDRREQSELWGEHRVARRISNVKGAVKENRVIGSFRSYSGDYFRRQLTWEEDGYLVISDGIIPQDKNKHIARQFFHLAPEYTYEHNDKKINIKKEEGIIATIRLPDICTYLIHTEGIITTSAEDFGKYLYKQVLEVRTQFIGRIELKVEIEIR